MSDAFPEQPPVPHRDESCVAVAQEPAPAPSLKRHRSEAPPPAEPYEQSFLRTAVTAFTGMYTSMEALEAPDAGGEAEDKDARWSRTRTANAVKDYFNTCVHHARALEESLAELYAALGADPPVAMFSEVHRKGMTAQYARAHGADAPAPKRAKECGEQRWLDYVANDEAVLRKAREVLSSGLDEINQECNVLPAYSLFPAAAAAAAEA